MNNSEDMRVTLGKRRRAGDSHLAFVVDEGRVKGPAGRWVSGTKTHSDVAGASPLEGVGAAISARAADH